MYSERSAAAKNSRVMDTLSYLVTVHPGDVVL